MVKKFTMFNNIYKNQKGFTLIEAMIAVVVFSFGLLGVAGVMIVSVKNNHNGYLRSQANIIAHSMIETMSTNSWDVWRNNYNGDYGYPATFSSVNTMCTAGSPCACNAYIARDQQQWTNTLVQTLPQGSATVACVPAIPMIDPQACVDPKEPYVGICTVTVSWNESNESNAQAQQSVVVRSNP